MTCHELVTAGTDEYGLIFIKNVVGNQTLRMKKEEWEYILPKLNKLLYEAWKESSPT